MYNASAPFLLSALLAFIPLRLEEDNCPAPCPATTTPSTTGEPAAGVTYQMLFLAPTDGKGTLTCATCTSCKMSGSLIFNGNGTGWCIQVAIDGVGSTNPLPVYARPGKLSAPCDGTDSVNITIVNCTTGTSSGYTQSMTLSCGCNPP